MAGNPIPTSVRVAVDKRDQRQCIRCGAPGREIHHRQRRREGGHGLENCILLCLQDHRWAHAHPSEARQAGFIVSAHVTDIEAVPIEAYYGRVLLRPSGKIAWAPAGVAS